ncbi:uncharacterized protein LOC5522146 isoform X2 [Nematostella vectensis]|uniref:uncharacterized protein LOC5522146 isoform X2 n=1 Tax=Nematostella vectensis TaxID=45351 RepID=UPI0020770ECF|nr:uncharacterized protein LOC5522146 isoform X2 [Nematostella vectensis]
MVHPSMVCRRRQVLLQWSVLTLGLLSVVNSLPECFEPDERVLSRWKNGNYYKGAIESLTNTLNVLFDTGVRRSYNLRDEVNVITDRVPEDSELTVGSRVLVNRPRSRAFQIGYIRDIVGGSYLIWYEDGAYVYQYKPDIRVFNKSKVCDEPAYLGCYRDKIPRTLSVYIPTQPATIGACVDMCKSQGFSIAALRNSNLCFCGISYSKEFQGQENECNTPCYDNIYEICGGNSAFSQYWTGIVTTRPNLKTGAHARKHWIPRYGELPWAAIMAASERMIASQQWEWDPYTRTWHKAELIPPQWPGAQGQLRTVTWHGSPVTRNGWTWNGRNWWPDARMQRAAHRGDSRGTLLGATKAPPPNMVYDYRRRQYVAVNHVQAQPRQYNTWSASSGLVSDRTQNQPTDRMDHVKWSQLAHFPTFTDAVHHLPEASTEFRYLGCYADKPNHDLPVFVPVKPLTVKACALKCRAGGYSVAGVQSSWSCYCGNTYSRYGRLKEDKCDMRCGGDSKEKCGGVSTNSVYFTGIGAAVPIPPKVPVSRKTSASKTLVKQLAMMTTNTSSGKLTVLYTASSKHTSKNGTTQQAAHTNVETSSKNNTDTLHPKMIPKKDNNTLKHGHQVLRKTKNHTKTPQQAKKKRIKHTKSSSADSSDDYEVESIKVKVNFSELKKALQTFSPEILRKVKHDLEKMEREKKLGEKEKKKKVKVLLDETISVQENALKEELKLLQQKANKVKGKLHELKTTNVKLVKPKNILGAKVEHDSVEGRQKGKGNTTHQSHASTSSGDVKGSNKVHLEHVTTIKSNDNKTSGINLVNKSRSQDPRVEKSGPEMTSKHEAPVRSHNASVLHNRNSAMKNVHHLQPQKTKVVKSTGGSVQNTKKTTKMVKGATLKRKRPGIKALSKQTPEKHLKSGKKVEKSISPSLQLLSLRKNGAKRPLTVKPIARLSPQSIKAKTIEKISQHNRNKNAKKPRLKQQQSKDKASKGQVLHKDKISNSNTNNLSRLPSQIKAMRENKASNSLSKQILDNRVRKFDEKVKPIHHDRLVNVSSTDIKDHAVEKETRGKVDSEKEVGKSNHDDAKPKVIPKEKKKNGNGTTTMKEASEGVSNKHVPHSREPTKNIDTSKHDPDLSSKGSTSKNKISSVRNGDHDRLVNVSNTDIKDHTVEKGTRGKVDSEKEVGKSNHDDAKTKVIPKEKKKNGNGTTTMKEASEGVSNKHVPHSIEPTKNINTSKNDPDLSSKGSTSKNKISSVRNGDHDRLVNVSSTDIKDHAVEKETRRKVDSEKEVGKANHDDAKPKVIPKEKKKNGNGTTMKEASDDVSNKHVPHSIEPTKNINTSKNDPDLSTKGSTTKNKVSLLPNVDTDPNKDGSELPADDASLTENPRVSEDFPENKSELPNINPDDIKAPQDDKDFPKDTPEPTDDNSISSNDESMLPKDDLDFSRDKDSDSISDSPKVLPDGISKPDKVEQMVSDDNGASASGKTVSDHSMEKIKGVNSGEGGDGNKGKGPVKMPKSPTNGVKASKDLSKGEDLWKKPDGSGSLPSSALTAEDIQRVRNLMLHGSGMIEVDSKDDDTSYMYFPEPGDPAKPGPDLNASSLLKEPSLAKVSLLDKEPSLQKDSSLVKGSLPANDSSLDKDSSLVIESTLAKDSLFSNNSPVFEDSLVQKDSSLSNIAQQNLVHALNDMDNTTQLNTSGIKLNGSKTLNNGILRKLSNEVQVVPSNVLKPENSFSGQTALNSSLPSASLISTTIGVNLPGKQSHLDHSSNAIERRSGIPKQNMGHAHDSVLKGGMRTHMLLTEVVDRSPRKLPPKFEMTPKDKQHKAHSKWDIIASYRKSAAVSNNDITTRGIAPVNKVGSHRKTKGNKYHSISERRLGKPHIGRKTLAVKKIDKDDDNDDGTDEVVKQTFDDYGSRNEVVWHGNRIQERSSEAEESW